ncbi:MAG: UTP--glucose-1-phosphate uridylyltransferase [Nannocystis sp.]|nr:UTP--glucose-1-phosphate uridylyltransferase [Nannocystis sp.]MBA3549256.1 UTP--glucose-1-phosphate uridylyltransferase [Nannocystis sp.]
MLPPTLAHAVFDADLFASLRQALQRGELSPERSRLKVAPAQLEPGALTRVTELTPEARVRLGVRGRHAIVAGEVAALVLNGGMATRFGGAVKGVVPVLPDHEQMSFLAVKLAGLRHAAIDGGGPVPIVLMHSFATAAASREHLENIDWSDVPERDRSSFEQSLLPRVLPDGTPLPELPDAGQLPDTTLFSAPGHGDTLTRLRDSGTLEQLMQRGVRHLMISNVDNLGATLDPVILGAHLEAVERGAALSVEVVEREPGDAGGCVADVGGRPQIIEAFRLPPRVELVDYPYFNTNTLWTTTQALQAPHPLTWFPVRKTIEWGDRAALEVIQFETLIGQLSEFVPTRCLLVDRARFLPIKTREDLVDAEPQIRAIVRAAGLHP